MPTLGHLARVVWQARRRGVTQGRSTVRVGVMAKSFLVTRMVNCALHAAHAQARSFGSVATTRTRVDRHKGHAIVNEFIDPLFVPERRIDAMRSPTRVQATVRSHVKTTVRRTFIDVRVRHRLETIAPSVDIAVRMACRDVAQPSRANRAM